MSSLRRFTQIIVCIGLGITAVLLGSDGLTPFFQGKEWTLPHVVLLAFIATALVATFAMGIKASIQIARVRSYCAKQGLDADREIVKHLHIRPAFRFLGGVLSIAAAVLICFLLRGTITAPWERWLEMVLFCGFFGFVALFGHAPRWFSNIFSKL